MKSQKTNMKTILTMAWTLGLMLFLNASQAAGKKVHHGGKSPNVVNLGAAGNFAILAESGITTTGTTSIVGDIGVSPIAATAMTGFGLVMDSSNRFSTSPLVRGKVYAADYASPTPSMLISAISDMGTAYNDAAGRLNPDETELGSGDISGMTLSAGLYKWSGVVTINGTLTLEGGPNDVFIFQIAGGLTVGSNAKVILLGVQAKNVFWQLAGVASMGPASSFQGIILSKTSVTMTSGATINGRALAQTNVTLISNAIAQPSR